MGWNCTISVVPGATLDDLRSAGISVSAERIYGDQATTGGSAGAAGELDGNLVLLASDPVGFDGFEELTRRIGRDGFDAIFSSVASTYVWRTVTAEGTRLLVWSQGEEVENSGPPHPAEAGLAELDEDSLFALLERATGFAAVLDGSAEPEGGGFHPITWPRPPDRQAPAPNDARPAEPKRRRWFRRG